VKHSHATSTMICPWSMGVTAVLTFRVGMGGATSVALDMVLVSLQQQQYAHPSSNSPDPEMKREDQGSDMPPGWDA
jgi:hypothetical protein